MNRILICLMIISTIIFSCTDENPENESSIQGFELLSELNGHWVGKNDTAFGTFDWFAFDFRPISKSHVHSIYEGGTNQNIITSVFVADYNGRKHIMARNGGWLGNQYRATYYILDSRSSTNESREYRLVDAAGGEDRSYIEFRFVNDSIYIDAYKDNSGTLDQPIHHMGFAGVNRNPNYAQRAIEMLDFPQEVSEVDLNGAFTDLIDPDSALFLEESTDPFPKSDHRHLSDLTINIERNDETIDDQLFLFISKNSLVDGPNQVNLLNIDHSVVRTIRVQSTEDSYLTTYLHPDDYYITVFSDKDGNGFPSAGDYTSLSLKHIVDPETMGSLSVEISELVE